MLALTKHLVVVLGCVVAASWTGVEARAIGMGASEGGFCTGLGTFAEHPVFCNRYFVCNQKQDDRGKYLNVYDLQHCANNTVWNNEGSFCGFADCGDKVVGVNEASSECTIGGDPHSHSYDNLWLHFQGGCQYVLSRTTTTCPADTTPFQVDVKNFHLGGNQDFSFLQYVTVTYKGVKFELDAEDPDNVKVNGVTMDYEVAAQQYANLNIKLFRLYGWLTLCLENGVIVSVRKFAQAKIKVSGSYQGCLEGLCGNYNSRKDDDFTTPDGTILAPDHTSYNLFGNLWKVGDLTCPNTTAPPIPICTGVQQYVKQCETALAYGQYGTPNADNAFTRCQAYGGIAKGLIESCVADLCALKNNETLITQSICQFVREGFLRCDSPDLDLDKMPPFCKYCTSGICQNGGTCSEERNGYSCECAPGYQGKNCEQEINECHTIYPNCLNGGECVDGVNSFSCNCVTGFEGPICETNTNDCIPEPCQNGGTCFDEVAGYACLCLPGFTDDSCGTNIDECGSQPCANGGTCRDLVNDYTCACTAGYTGTNCGTDINECSGTPTPCQHTCTNTEGSYECSCNPGFQLLADGSCTNIDECGSQPCANGGTCRDLVNDYTCACTAGFTGTNCGTDIDECSGTPTPCQHTCTNTEGSYECSCNPGFQLLADGSCINIDDCSPQPCANGGTCTDLVNDYTCACTAGYTGPNCGTDTDDCAAAPCQNGGTCIDRENTYTCSCEAGFEGENCEIDIDECGSQPCANGGTCRDLVNGYTCACTAGYTGPNCGTDIDECSGTPTPCQHTCTNTEGSYECSCNPGFQLLADGSCINIDDCSPQPCANGGTCTDLVNDYTCACTAGYTGPNCGTDTDECASAPCQNGGTCNDGENTYTCLCEAGFEGENCEIDIDECARSRSRCDDICVNTYGSYYCNCSYGYIFNKLRGICEVENPCLINPCYNGGLCQPNQYYEYEGEGSSVPEAFICVCPDGFDGTLCDHVIDRCLTYECKNGGTCRKNRGVAYCDCTVEYIGDHCEEEVQTGEVCTPPCQNGGSCHNEKCVCLDDYEGEHCQIDCSRTPENPTCVCRNCKFANAAHDYWPKSDDCNAYYVCQLISTPGNPKKYILYTMPCPPFLQWSSDALSCVIPLQSDCGAIDIPIIRTTAAPTTTGPTVTVTNACGFSIQKHPDNCHQYQICDNDKVKDMCCPPNLIFDEVASVCSWAPKTFDFSGCHPLRCRTFSDCDQTECCYLFNSETQLDDTSVNHHATDKNGPPVMIYPQRGETGAVFDGIRDFLAVSGFAGKYLGKEPTSYTIEIEFSYGGDGDDLQGLVLNGDCLTEPSFGMVLVTGVNGNKFVECFINNRTVFTVRSQVIITPGATYRVIFVYNSVQGSLKLNVNGELKEETAYAGPIRANLAKLHIGFDYDMSDDCEDKNEGFFKGTMYMLKLYKQARQIPDNNVA